MSQAAFPFRLSPSDDRSFFDCSVGQTRDVEVYTLISAGTIDEDIDDLARSKLALDAAVAGREDDSSSENATEAKAKSSLLSKLRTKLDIKLDGQQPEASKEMAASNGEGSKTAPPPSAVIDVDMEP